MNANTKSEPSTSRSAKQAPGYADSAQARRSRATAWRSFGIAALAGAIAASAGCNLGPQTSRIMVGVVMAEKTNQNSPVPVSFVAVRDQKLFDKLLQMTAKQWFEQRDQLRRDDPQGVTFTEWEWEYVPGQSPPPVVIEVDSRSVGAVIFFETTRRAETWSTSKSTT